MKVTRKKAIKVILSATDQDGWADFMENEGLYVEKKDEVASIYDLFSAIGVSEKEVNEALGNG